MITTPIATRTPTPTPSPSPTRTRTPTPTRAATATRAQSTTSAPSGSVTVVPTATPVEEAVSLLNSDAMTPQPVISAKQVSTIDFEIDEDGSVVAAQVTPSAGSQATGGSQGPEGADFSGTPAPDPATTTMRRAAESPPNWTSRRMMRR